MAVQNPWAGVVRDEPDRGVVARGCAGADDVAHDGVDEVVARVAGGADDVEGVPVQMEWMLSDDKSHC